MIYPQPKIKEKPTNPSLKDKIFLIENATITILLHTRKLEEL